MLEHREIAALHWCASEDLDEHVADYTARLVRAALEATEPLYLGTPVPAEQALRRSGVVARQDDAEEPRDRGDDDRAHHGGPEELGDRERQAELAGRYTTSARASGR